ncbi:Flagellar transcriptional regulator ftcR [Bartonella clarridgeiae 73]|uniref:Flagellar transcriptional regulator ftcR n=1 Tax=Bartonella clarridgeiae (strain CCUG 45776 / CIP 104772 / 73) TaxID=696125 RepID=E6YH26_BARC7|nr:response regulator transcription factor [Bartonella clarridgeiae]CBI76164.1 Flagellar transcriptional regulator ftcR [Bartonella clarridgeiae 73]
MIVVVDDRKLVTDGYATLFSREGVAATGLPPSDFSEWISTASDNEISSIEAILLGKCENQIELPKEIRNYSSAPILAMTETNILSHTIELFQSGMDDVLRKPIHVREILARIGAIRRRIGNNIRGINTAIEVGPISVFNDGRDPQINGIELALPRRERRILEYLIANAGKRVNKTQIFNAVYGIFDDAIEENVIESHISKLRKKLKAKIGYDIIDSKRFLGYSLQVKDN